MSESSVSAIGIDLGTTNSCVAIYLNGRTEVLANDVGQRTTPSYVGFKNGQTLVGEMAKGQAYRNIKNTIFDVKRLMGKRYNDSKVQEGIKYWPFDVSDRNGNPAFKIENSGKEVFYSPEEISAEILKKLKDVASKRMEATVTKAVITVPAYFNDSQRQATKDAGELAGLEVLMLLNEPTAAAITYALEKNLQYSKHALVFDFGGGTFDVSIIKFEKQRVTVKAVHGDTHLGGNDIDRQLMTYFIEDIELKFNCDIQRNHRSMARLNSACETVKRWLSFKTEAEIELDAFIDGKDYNIELTREKLEHLNKELFVKTLEIVKNCLKAASLTTSDIDNVLLVGGSTRIPRIKDLLQDLFRDTVLTEAVHPDEAVAIGAAIQAANLNKNDSQQVITDFVLRDVVPFSLGIGLENGLMYTIIKQYTLVPATITENNFGRPHDKYLTEISVYEGQSKFLCNNHLLGSFVLRDIAPQDVANISVTFHIDVNGILSVTATEKVSNKTNSITITTNDRCRISMEEKVTDKTN